MFCIQQKTCSCGHLFIRRKESFPCFTKMDVFWKHLFLKSRILSLFLINWLVFIKPERRPTIEHSDKYSSCPLFMHVLLFANDINFSEILGKKRRKQIPIALACMKNWRGLYRLNVVNSKPHASSYAIVIIGIVGYSALVLVLFGNFLWWSTIVRSSERDQQLVYL